MQLRLLQQLPRVVEATGVALTLEDAEDVVKAAVGEGLEEATVEANRSRQTRTSPFKDKPCLVKRTIRRNRR